MQTYIALLRGINVSGQKIIKMEKLREALSQEGFGEVQTYIQSGNVIFQSNDKKEKLQEKIAEIIEKHFGFEVVVIIRTLEELKAALNGNPFAKENETKRNYFAFLSELPKQIDREAIDKQKGLDEKYEITGDMLYIHYGDGQGKTKFTTNFLERKLGLSMTVRNLNSCEKLIYLAENL